MKIQISEHFTYKKLFRFVLPSIVMMVFTSIYGVVDGLFVSNFVGKTAFASINLIMPFIMILGGMGFMIGTGGVALVLRTLGMGKSNDAKRYFTMLVVFAVFFGAVLTAVGIGFVRPISRLLGATDDMIEHCVLYGRIVMGFTIFFMLQSMFQSFLVAAEKPGLGLVVTVIPGCTNAVLDAVFIAGFKWGLVGAAVATGIGQFVGGFIPLVYFMRPNKSLLRFTRTRLEIKPILRACGNGSSELLTNVASSVVSMLYNFRLLVYFGENGVSAYGVIMYVQFIFLAIEIGYSVGVAPIISYNYGSGNSDELKNLFKKSLIVMSFSGVILAAAAEALAVPLSMLFVGYDKELFDLTVFAFRIFSIAFVFSGVNIFSSGFFTALNNGVVSAILSFSRALVLQVGFVLLLPAVFGANGIWWAMFATEVGALIVAVSFFIAKRKRYNYA